ncbi:acyl-CoA dehydratase activase-related protein [Wukongibacter baidiensis]|uniref:acyl-CoA dehydratase activase-related protein n=1 Tax=Wukongibacter baidiensis TaxID=1723361 RepID=UPI003D800053
MPVKVGIPRSLLFYEYYSLWISFFEELGAEVIISPRTNKEIVDKGVKSTVDEACLPVKVFHGHVIDLKDKVDYIFVPRIISVRKNEYICPKFCGLPEMVKYSIRDLPKFIDTSIDFRKSKKNLNKTVTEIGSYITSDAKKIKRAFEYAMEKYSQYKVHLKMGLLPIDTLKENNLRDTNHLNNGAKVLLLGHPYNIYDSYLSMDIVDKLRRNNLTVLTCDSLRGEVINKKADTLDKQMFWSFGRKIIGTALHTMEDNQVCGIIYLSSFGCGLDSVIGDIVERKIRRSSNKPFTMLTLDEHTGEAGVDTRIEAFVDMIRWREEDENNLSAYR